MIECENMLLGCCKGGGEPREYGARDGDKTDGRDCPSVSLHRICISLNFNLSLWSFADFYVTNVPHSAEDHARLIGALVTAGLQTNNSFTLL